MECKYGKGSVLEVVILKFHPFRNVCRVKRGRSERVVERRDPDHVGENSSDREHLCWQFSPSPRQDYPNSSQKAIVVASIEDAYVMERKVSSILTL